MVSKYDAYIGLKNTWSMRKLLSAPLKYHGSDPYHRISDDRLACEWIRETINCDCSYGHYQKKMIVADKTGCRVNRKKINDEEDVMCGVRIKKTDILTVDELKENIKPYNQITLLINEEKYDSFEKEYGSVLFTCPNDKRVELDGYTIEFFEKALRISGGWSHESIPLDWIDKVICEYYIEPTD